MQQTENIIAPDMTYDFASHFRGNRGSLPFFLAAVVRYAHLVKRMAAGEVWYATDDGGWPRCGIGRVLAVGMQPAYGKAGAKLVPSVLIDGWLGAEWSHFNDLTDIMPEDDKDKHAFWRISDRENRRLAADLTPSLVVKAEDGHWDLNCR